MGSCCAPPPPQLGLQESNLSNGGSNRPPKTIPRVGPTQVHSASSLVSNGTGRSTTIATATTDQQNTIRSLMEEDEMDQVEWVPYGVQSWPVKFLSLKSLYSPSDPSLHKIQLLEPRWKNMRLHEIVVDKRRGAVVEIQSSHNFRDIVDAFFSQQPDSFEYMPRPIPNSYHLIQSISFVTPSKSVKLLNIFCDEDDVRSRPGSPSIGSRSRESLLIPGLPPGAGALAMQSGAYKANTPESPPTHDFLARVYDFSSVSSEDTIPQPSVTISDISFGITGTSSRDFLSSKAHWINESTFIYGNYWYNLSPTRPQSHKFFDLSESNSVFVTPNCYRIFHVCPKLKWIIGAYFPYSGSRLGKPYELVILSYSQSSSISPEDLVIRSSSSERPGVGETGGGGGEGEDDVKIADEEDDDLRFLEEPKFVDVISFEDYNLTYVPVLERVDGVAKECLIWVGKRSNKFAKHSAPRKQKWRDNCHRWELIRIYEDEMTEKFRSETLFQFYMDTHVVQTEPLFSFWGQHFVTFPFMDRIFAINFLFLEHHRLNALISPYVGNVQSICDEILEFLPRLVFITELEYMFTGFGKDGSTQAMRLACHSFENGQGHVCCVLLPDTNSGDGGDAGLAGGGMGDDSRADSRRASRVSGISAQLNASDGTNCHVGFANSLGCFLDEALEIDVNENPRACGPDNYTAITPSLGMIINRLPDKPINLVFWKNEAQQSKVV